MRNIYNHLQRIRGMENVKINNMHSTHRVPGIFVQKSKKYTGIGKKYKNFSALYYEALRVFFEKLENESKK